MNIVLNLGCLALQQVVDGACQTVGFPVAEGSVLGVSKFLARHFTDSSQHLVKALNAANERAWKALELALAGQSFWERLKGTLAQGDQKAFAHQVKTFLESNLLLELKGRSAEVRRNCLQELQTARKAGLLQANNLSPEELANRVGHFARFLDPQQRIAEEMKLVSEVALALRQNGYRYLAWLLDQQVSRGTSLLVAAVQFFFKREVESNPELWRGLAWASWQNMAEAQQKGFGCLTAALVQNSQKVEELLAGTHRVALDILEEVRGQKNQIKQLGEAVLQLLALHRMDNRELRPQDSQSIRDREERDQVRHLLEHFRKLPPEDRAKLPAVLNGLGQLQHAAGDFPAAQTTFVEVAVAATDTRAKAEAFHSSPPLCLLATMLSPLTAGKVARLVRGELCQKRGGGKVRSEADLAGAGDEGASVLEQVVGQEPTPEFAAQLAETCQQLLVKLGSDELRAIAVWRMEGYTVDEISGKFGRSSRTVARKLELIRGLWREESLA